jgi:uncharacterized protein
VLIERKLGDKIKKSSLSYPIVIVTGPRQSGKTTLVKNLFPHYKYISLEDMDNREYAINDPRGFLSVKERGIIIDEVQNVPMLLSYIQTMVDSSGKEGQFILTGSQNILLHSYISQSLAGRASILKLLPFSIEELNNHKITFSKYEDLMYKGFYPRIYDKKLNPTEWYSNYVLTYIERDVRQLKNISNLNLFQKFIRICAGRAGQLLNYSSIANEIGVSHQTVSSWLSILEMSYIVFFVQPYHTNYNKRIVKMPKLYFHDPGLLCYLLGINNKSQVETNYLKGALFENLIFSELMKNYYNRGLEPKSYFWRDKTGHEIDAIIETDKINAVEIKAGRTINSDFFNNLKYWQNITNNEKENAYLIYGGKEIQKREYGNVAGWNDCYKLFNRLLS